MSIDLVILLLSFCCLAFLMSIVFKDVNVNLPQFLTQITGPENKADVTTAGRLFKSPAESIKSISKTQNKTQLFTTIVPADLKESFKESATRKYSQIADLSTKLKQKFKPVDPAKQEPISSLGMAHNLLMATLSLTEPVTSRSSSDGQLSKRKPNMYIKRGLEAEAKTAIVFQRRTFDPTKDLPFVAALPFIASERTFDMSTTLAANVLDFFLLAPVRTTRRIAGRIGFK